MYWKENKIYMTPNNNRVKEINLMYETLLTTFGQEVVDEITHARFDFKELEYTYFIAKYKEIWVQIRIPKSKFFSTLGNEYIVVKNFKDYLFVKDGIIIKKWFPGVNLFQVKIDNNLIQSILNCIKNFHSLDIKIKKFNWNKFNINDRKYHELLHKYKDDNLVLSHNNIQKHNILVNKYGFVKLVDFEDVCLNSPYYDFVLIYLNIGIDKKVIIDFFELDEQKFDDYLYLVNVYGEAKYKKTYSNLTINKNKEYEPLNVYKNKMSPNNNKFIVHKKQNQFDNRLEIDKISSFYFVPTCIYEDGSKVIWRWLNNKENFVLTTRSVKILAKIMRTYHDSEIKFPEFILDKKVIWHLNNVNNQDLFLEIGNQKIINEIISWIKNIKIDANCHNNLNVQNILWGDNQSIFIIDWSVAYRSSRFLDIALMFENLNILPNQEELFWKVYGKQKPNEFYKYRVIVLFTHYLYNKTLNTDYEKAKYFASRVRQILDEEKIK